MTDEIPVLDDEIFKLAADFHGFDFNQDNGNTKFCQLIKKTVARIKEKADTGLSLDQLWGQYIWAEVVNYPDDEGEISSVHIDDMIRLLKENGAQFDDSAVSDHIYLISQHYS